MRQLTDRQFASLPAPIARRCNDAASNTRDVAQMVRDLKILQKWVDAAEERIVLIRGKHEERLDTQISLVLRYAQGVRDRIELLRRTLDSAMGEGSWQELMAQAHGVIANDARSMRDSHSLNGKIVDSLNSGVEDDILEMESLARQLGRAVAKR